jgi:hypothetical protein
MILKQLIKKLLVHSPLPYSERLDTMHRLALLRAWLTRQRGHPIFPTREAMFAHLANIVMGPVPITYLEFGVYRGNSIRIWAGLNANPASTFVGFDSFEGLPETWVNVGKTLEKGTFSTGGAFPAIDDPRVTFVKGWFQNTLPQFVRDLAQGHQLVIHCDADLYSSTLFVLCTLNSVTEAGTIVIFDDFSSMLNEFRALEDYTRAFGRHYEVLTAAHGHGYYKHLAIRLLKSGASARVAELRPFGRRVA